jgi:dTDP-4-amino-4,6-dideoxygalactose transaminase
VRNAAPDIEPSEPPLLTVTQPDLPPLEEFIPLLESIWASRRLTNRGPFHVRFSQALAEYLGVPHVALFANATLALLVAQRALGLTGEVVTTPFSFVATAHTLLWNRVQPVFADIDPESLCLDPAQVEAALSPRTSAILPVHVYGRSCDTARLQALAQRHGVKLLYDAAHAFGVCDAGGSLLRHGDASVLSFHATKVFNTFEGGALVSHDPALQKRVADLKNFGFANEVTVLDVGINAKMSEFQAALGLLQLGRVDLVQARRSRIDARYRERLAGVPGLQCLPLPPLPRYNHAYFPVRVMPAFALDRDALYARLKANGVLSRRYFYPLISEFPMYKDLPSARPDRLPVATEVARQILCLPIFPDLPLEQVDRVADLIVGT